jgi:Flp pilus assembly protein TadG
MFGQSLGKMKRWLLQESEEPRRAPRIPLPEVIVHYWDGSAPEGRRLRDISQTGAYIYTTERWYLGTIIRIILQGYQAATPINGTPAPKASISIPAMVVRHGSDGVAVEFVFRDKEAEAELHAFLAKIPAQPPITVAPGVIPGGKARRGGQALIEFALILPLVFLLAINAVNFGGFIFAWITVADAARAGAQYMVMSSASPGSPSPATLAQVTALVTSDVTSLLNRSSVVVAVCTNQTQAATGCTSLIDPEAPAYTLATVDVTYTYKPYIPLFSFPQLGIAATLPPGPIHRKAVMRMLQ